MIGILLQATPENIPLTIFKIIVLGIPLLALYMLPTIIGRKKRNIGAIAALNLLLGWTLIGWVVALVWGLTKDESK